MEFANCPKCGKIFSRTSSSTCEQCEKKDEELFQTVKEYVDANKYCTIMEVSKAMDISVKKLMKYLRDGRLEASEGMGNILKCEKCNKPIKTGHFCDTCVIALNQTVSTLYTPKDVQYKGKKHLRAPGLKHVENSIKH